MNFGGTIRINRLGLCIIVGACILLFYYLNSDSKNPTDDIKNDQGNYINLRRLLIAAIEVAEKGGKEVYKVRQGKDIKERNKGDLPLGSGIKDPLTAADDQSNCVMYFSLKHNFPKLKIVTEEEVSPICPEVPTLELDLNVAQEVIEFTKESVPLDDVTVWIDPLDATKEYTENLLTYVTTMVCVAVKGTPVIGVIHKPFEKGPNTYWAWVGKGHSKNLNPHKQEDTKLKITVSRSHAGDVQSISEKAFGKDVQVVAAAGSGYKSLELVQGRVSAYLHTTNIKKWDVCAPDALVTAVGGQLTTLTGKHLDYSAGEEPMNREGLLATWDKHDWFLERLRSALTPPLPQPQPQPQLQPQLQPQPQPQVQPQPEAKPESQLQPQPQLRR